ncbi:UNVERIFIED_CONTAM: hypothetical protein Scaly_2370300 [Sesamum calycinum]|uniref:Protein FAM32A-like n=1 Tax=Sesamum calycinum TaxID=2727403 RepID=A0AAW2LXF1_9LAMI
MSAYENVVAGKLRLKGKALDVKDDPTNSDVNATDVHNEELDQDERLTPAERRYLERWQKIELERLAKIAKKSHRDRIQEFNQYLANLSEHYDIPKVGPG